MRRKAGTAVALAATVMLSGCATTMPQGVAYTDVKLPVDAESGPGGDKVGEATCHSVLTLVATGDCSIEAARQDGNISEVTHVDWEATNILGIIGNYKLTVYGN